LLLDPLVVRDKRPQKLTSCLPAIAAAVLMELSVEVFDVPPGDDPAESVDGLLIEVGDFGPSSNGPVQGAGDRNLTLWRARTSGREADRTIARTNFSAGGDCGKDSAGS
jgi:hypothetical protein